MRADRLRIVLLLMLIMLCAAPAALANSAEPPGYTVIVTHPPEGLSLFLSAEEGGEEVLLPGEKRGWESWYRFYYHTVPGSRDWEGQPVLTARWAGEACSFAVPEAHSAYNNILVLDVKAGILTDGQPAWRVPLLVSLRVGLTLLIEGAVFFLFGYRQRRSWLVFLAVNLVTQGGLNAMITGPNIGAYWMLGFAAMEALILLAEMLAMAHLLREGRKGRAVLYAAAANIASLLAGGWIIGHLPV